MPDLLFWERFERIETYAGFSVSDLTDHQSMCFFNLSKISLLKTFSYFVVRKNAKIIYFDQFL